MTVVRPVPNKKTDTNYPVSNPGPCPHVGPWPCRGQKKFKCHTLGLRMFFTCKPWGCLSDDGPAEAAHSDLGGECPHSAGWASRSCGARKNVSQQWHKGLSNRQEKKAAFQQQRQEKEQRATKAEADSQPAKVESSAGPGRQAWVADMKKTRKGRAGLDDQKLLCNWMILG